MQAVASGENGRAGVKGTGLLQLIKKLEEEGANASEGADRKALCPSGERATS